MSMLQIGFLVLVFVATAALAVWLVQWAGGNAAGARLKRVLDGSRSDTPAPAAGWLERFARVAGPLGRLSAPDEGYEGSALRRRMVNAGIRSTSAPVTRSITANRRWPSPSPGS